ncbi:FadR/GntR family transcriptional regulator [Alkalilacustris brevis]|uniref:FadR/GntR family transcriptional regulator n=1 Tax=Alkalilacustris brevis TaxID=2026338 RepID=UPI000E0D6651|nr:FCD domain-containing protein [Alkalilacustris brevis]
MKTAIMTQKPSHSSDLSTVEARIFDILDKPEMQPGTRLPTERSLSEELGVSRNTVRRVFARLEASGRVVRIIGSGTYVAKASTPPLADAGAATRDFSPQEIMESRLLIEPRFATLIVMNANSADIAALADALARADDAPDFASFELWDGRFHQLLADATHNKLLVEVYKIITLSRETAEWGDLKRGSITDERRATYKREHRDILEALQTRNAKQAERAITVHLQTVRDNLFGF